MSHPEGITKDEVNAFRKECTARGRHPDDFILGVLDSALRSDIGTSRIITVRRDAIIRCYTGSFGFDWIKQFVDDMRAGRWL